MALIVSKVSKPSVKWDTPGLFIGNELPSWNHTAGSLYSRSQELDAPKHVEIDNFINGDQNNLESISDSELLLMQHELIQERNYIEFLHQNRSPLPEGCLKFTYRVPLAYFIHSKILQCLVDEQKKRAQLHDNHVAIPIFKDDDFETALQTFKLSEWSEQNVHKNKPNDGSCDKSLLKVGQKYRLAIEVIRNYYDKLVVENMLAVTRSKNVWDILFESKESIINWININDNQKGEREDGTPNWLTEILS